MATFFNTRWIGAIVIACVICPVFCSNILVLPGAPIGNVYITITRFGELLAMRGHNVTILINDLYYHRFAGLIKQQRTFMNFEEYKSGFNEFPDAYNQVTKSVHNVPSIFETLSVFDALADETEAFIQDSNIIERLKATNFDLILANSFNPGYALIVGTLRVPLIVLSTVRSLPMVDDLIHGLTSNPAYVPAILTGYSDVMTFPQRLSNTFVYLASGAMLELLLLKPFKSVKQRHNIRPELSYRSLCGNAELVLFCSDFVFDYPRPMMPHGIYIGSLTARPPVPLSQEWTEFVESAEEGVVVFTLGSQISIGEDLEKATKFVRAFARLPQKVIMRYVGEPLNGVGENTKLSSWIPQNDLLGHPNTKAFIGHGGINGINEAIYHGVPFIGVAALGDQAENIGRLVNKGMAIALNLHSFSEDDVYNAVKKVIEDSRYKENAARLSSIQKDTPMSPGDTAVFWIEHILKFGGDHLKPASLQLNFVQYFLLDIVAFVLVVFAFVIIVSKLVIQQVCKMCCKPTKKKQL